MIDDERTPGRAPAGAVPGRARSRARDWAAVTALAGATFTVVTSEMLPVGLLTPMGEGLGVSEGAAGLALAVTGIVAAVSAPLVTPALARFDRRLLLCALMALLAAGNLLAACAPGFAVLMAARVLVGLAMGAVWSLAAAVAVRLAPPGAAGPATSLVFSGIAVASVLGVPAGAYAGGAAGWRVPFAGAGVLALAVLAALAVALPPLPPAREVRLRGVLRVAARPPVARALAAVALLVTGHFAAYTYVRPVLEDVAGAGSGTVGALLLAYGTAGVAGNFAAGAAAARAPRGTLLVLGAALAATAALLPAAAVLPPGPLPAAAVLLVLWGLAYGGVSVTAQTWLPAVAPGAAEEASALFVGVFNGAIAVGALGGGVAADHAGTGAVMWLGAALAAASLLPALLRPSRTRPADRAPATPELAPQGPDPT